MASFRGRIIKIGKILHKSPIAPNILIAKVSSYIEEGIVIYDSEGNKIGIAIETFGPTQSPYLRIKSENHQQLETLSEKEIFIIENVKEKVSWRKKRRRKRYGRR